MPYDTDIRGDATRRAFINARLIDPSQGLDTTGGIVIADGRIVASGANVTRASLTNGIDVTDCKGNLLMPGLIDMRVFTGEPGNEYRETLETASHAAAAGGVTTMVVMPNTEPAIDEPAIVDFIKRRARDTAIVRVAPMAAITRPCCRVLMERMASSWCWACSPAPSSSSPPRVHRYQPKTAMPM